MGRAACILAALSLGSALRARAQEPWIAEPGQRVRITYDCPVAAGATGSPPAGCHRAAGTLVRLHGDSLTLTAGHTTTSYPLSAVSLLELSRGRKSHWLAGAGVGFLAGTGTVLILLNSTGSSSTNICDTANNQDAAGWGACLGIAAVAGGLPLGLIGGLVGLALKTDRWEETPRDRLRVNIVPYRDGVVLGASLRF